MAKSTIFMGTTSIDSGRTAAEISGLLVASGARQIACDYAPTGKITGLRFTIPVNSVVVAFALPVRIDPILKHVRGDKAQAERVAWRQLYRWVQAQLALIEVGMVKAEEVYAPYMLQPNGQTLFEFLCETTFKQLAAPKEGL